MKLLGIFRFGKSDGSWRPGKKGMLLALKIAGHGGMVCGLDKPFEAPEIHDDVVLHPLEGDGGDSPHQLSLLHGDDVDVLGPDACTSGWHRTARDIPSG